MLKGTKQTKMSRLECSKNWRLGKTSVLCEKGMETRGSERRGVTKADSSNVVTSRRKRSMLRREIEETKNGSPLPPPRLAAELPSGFKLSLSRRHGRPNICN